MAKLVYSVICSLDGYIEDADGNFDWAAPDEEVHAFVNAHERSIGTYLYGRGMYETMVVWETFGTGSDDSAVVRDYAAIWRAADKVVYSTMLESTASARTRIERSFDVDAVRAMKESATQDISVGGPGLAARAMESGLIDEYHFFVVPVVVGGGKAALPDGYRVALELLEVRRFERGFVHLHYRTRD
jgi:dihydrofolate reductase